jgi:hypothetical protein
MLQACSTVEQACTFRIYKAQFIDIQTSLFK